MSATRTAFSPESNSSNRLPTNSLRQPRASFGGRARLEFARAVGDQLADVVRRADQIGRELRLAADAAQRGEEELAEHRKSACAACARALRAFVLGQVERRAGCTRRSRACGGAGRPAPCRARPESARVGRAARASSTIRSSRSTRRTGWLRRWASASRQWNSSRTIASARGVEARIARDPPPALVRKRPLDLVLPVGHFLFQPLQPAELPEPLRADRVAQRLQIAGVVQARIRSAACDSGRRRQSVRVSCFGGASPRTSRSACVAGRIFDARPARRRSARRTVRRAAGRSAGRQNSISLRPAWTIVSCPGGGERLPERRQVVDRHADRSPPIRRRRRPGSGTTPAGRCVPRRTPCRTRSTSAARAVRSSRRNCFVGGDVAVCSCTAITTETGTWSETNSGIRMPTL